MNATVRIAVGVILLVGCEAGVRAQVPAVVVYRVGNGTGNLTNTGSPVFLDEYDAVTGVLLESIAMPTVAAGANGRLVASGTATSEGMLTVSPDGNYLALEGYNSSAPWGGSTTVVGTSASFISRTVGIINVNTRNIDTTTRLADWADGNNPRSAVTSNGTDIWVTGAAGGVRYTTIGQVDSSQLTTVNNLRQVNIFDGQLYASSASSAVTGAGPINATPFGTVGTGLPTFAPLSGQGDCTISYLPNTISWR